MIHCCVVSSANGTYQAFPDSAKVGSGRWIEAPLYGGALQIGPQLATAAGVLERVTQLAICTDKVGAIVGYKTLWLTTAADKPPQTSSLLI